jgi:hypothetical protein
MPHIPPRLSGQVNVDTKTRSASKRTPRHEAGAVVAMRLTVAEDYFFFVVALRFAADLVVFFETGFLGDAMVELLSEVKTVMSHAHLNLIKPQYLVEKQGLRIIFTLLV